MLLATNDTKHTLLIGDIPDLSSLYASVSHAHAASAITSGVLDNARVNWAAPDAIGTTTPPAITAAGVTSTKNFNYPLQGTRGALFSFGAPLDVAAFMATSVGYTVLAGFGVSLRFWAASEGNASRQLGWFKQQWGSPTDASRWSYFSLSAYNIGTERTILYGLADNPRVGINVASPSAVLDVAEVSGNALNIARFTISESSTSIGANHKQYVGYKNSNNTNNVWSGVDAHYAFGGTVAALIGVQITDQTNAYGSWQLWTRGTTGGAVRLAIDPNGIMTKTSVGAETNSVATAVQFIHNSTGTPAAGYGFGSAVQGRSSTTNSRDMSMRSSLWEIATDASRRSRLLDSVYLISTKTDVLGQGVDGADVGSAQAFFFGRPNADGSWPDATWRIIRNGNNLEIQRRESAAWVVKSTIAA